MNEELLSSSDKYLKKSNRTLLLVGIFAFLAFFIGLIVLLSGGEAQKEDAKVTVEGASDAFTDITGGDADNFSNFDEPSTGVKLNVTPDVMRFDQVVLGTSAEGALTITPSSGRVSIMEIAFENNPDDGFKLESKCKPNDILTTDLSCTVIVKWEPKTARTIQSNLAIKWRDETAGAIGKTVLVSVSAMAIDTSLCGVCDEAPGGGTTADQLRQKGRLILGPDGKPIGYADENGVVYGLDGKRIGTLRPDGTVVDDQGYIIGVAEGVRVALGPDGSIIGTILPDGRVIDKDGNLIGYALPDGTIVDLNGNVIGAAMRTGTAVDKNGNPIGRVMPDGRVLDENGNLIGYLNPDGTIVDLNGNIIGSVMPSGAVVDALGRVLGIVMPDGSVVDKDGNVIGRVLPNGFVVDKDGNIIGRVIKEGLAIGPGCRLIGRVSTDGSVMSSNKQVGRLTAAMIVVDMGNNPVGGYVQEGAVLGWDGKTIGKIDSDGQPVSFKGDLLGCLLPNAAVVNDSEEMIGALRPYGTVVGTRCGFEGRVMPDGSVVNNGELKGRILPDKTFLREDGTIGGAIARSNVGLAPGCANLGFANIDGQMMTTKGEFVGCLAANGDVLDDKYVVLGRVLDTGTAIGIDGRMIGILDSAGKIVDKNGKVLACMDPDYVAISETKNEPVGMATPQGGVLDRDGRTVGWVMPDASVKNTQGGSVGKTLGDASVVDMTGQKVARVVPFQGLPLKAACEPVGRIIMDGRIVDKDFKRTAYLRLDDSLADEQDNFIGRLATAQHGIDSRSTYVGAIDETGALINQAGEKVGCLRPDNLFVDSDGKFKAAQMLTGLAVNPQTDLYARGDSIGKALNLKGTDFVGKTLVSTYIQNDDKTVTGGIIPAGAAVLDIKTSKPIGRLLPDGNAVNLQSRFLGRLKMPGGDVVDRAGTVVGRVFVGLRQVIGPNGEILGVVLSDGTVIDANGKVIGQADLQGKVVDKDGNVIGEVLPVGMPVLGADGKIIGYVGLNGEIVDEDGKPVLGEDGKPLRYRSGGMVVSADGKVVGFTLNDGLAIGFDNKVLGTINAQAVVRNANGTDLGTMQVDGTVVDTMATPIGRGLINAVPVGRQCRGLGAVNSEGKVVSASGDELGFVTFDRAVLDATNTQIGIVLSPDSVIDRPCNITGEIGRDGKFRSASGNETGCVDFDGIVTNKNTKRIGTVILKGPVIGFDGKVFGKVVPNGEVLDADGNVLGCFGADGAIYNKSNTLTGVSDLMKYAVDAKGKTVARIVGGKYGVSRENDKLVGMLEGGRLLDDKGTEIGLPVPAGRRVIGRDGRIVGTVLPKGGVAADNGENKGFVTSRMRALTPDNKFLGRVVPVGEECKDKGGQVVGKVHFDGTIVDENVEVLGRIMANGTALSNAGTYLCSISPMSVVDDVWTGKAVYDANGNLIGYVDEDGNVRDASGKIIGRVMPDGTVVDLNGNTIGYVALGEPVYDANGKLIGFVGADGIVRDAQGNVIGTLRPDGTVVDENGNIIGKTLGTPLYDADGNLIGFVGKDGVARDLNGNVLGVPVFDENGKLIGFADKDGKVRDLKGNVIGTLRPDGTVVDENGNIIGKALGTPLYDADGNLIGFVGKDGVARDLKGNVLGVPVYDANGKLIGFADKDGTVRDLKGNVIGKVLPDGTVVDLNGNVIGKIDSRAMQAKKNVRIAVGRDGKFLGIVGEDGFVRDANGNIIGKVLPDGTVVDLNGNVIGSVIEGEPLYDENGNLIGVVKADGTVVDLNGNVLGHLNADGEIVDKDGNVIGIWKNGKLTMQGDKLKPRFAFDKNGNRIGIVLPDGTVIDANGNIIGHVDENGNVIGLDGEIIGSLTDGGGKEGKDKDKVSVFGKFDPDSYRYRGKGLGAGGGTGKGERYDPSRIKELRAKQMAYRKMIRPGLGAGLEEDSESALLKKQHRANNWSSININKNVSSYRVKMDNMILADKAIPAVLTRSIDSLYSDVPVSAVVERNVYSESGRKVIIPAGSRLIGEQGNAGAAEENSIAVKMQIKWTRLIRPDGAAFKFEDGASGDAQGRAGVSSYVDLQLIRKFGTPLLQSTVSSALLWAMSSNSKPEVGDNGEIALSDRQQAAQDARSQFSDDMRSMFDSIFAMTSKIPARSFVPSGTRITVFAKEDLWLRSEVEDNEVNPMLGKGLVNEKMGTEEDLRLQKQKMKDKGEDMGGLTQEQVNQNTMIAGGTPNNPQMQQQIYYNSYGQPVMPQQGGLTPQQVPAGYYAAPPGYYGYAPPPQSQLLTPPAPQQPKPQSAPALQESVKDEDPAPELF